MNSHMKSLPLHSLAAFMILGALCGSILAADAPEKRPAAPAKSKAAATTNATVRVGCFYLKISFNKSASR